MASNSTAGTPLDIWFPASPNIKPQISDQLSLGYFRNFFDNRLESSFEVYYKKMTNSIDFRDHAQLLLNPRLEGELRIGEATSYGAELYLKYEISGFSGFRQPVSVSKIHKPGELKRIFHGHHPCPGDSGTPAGDSYG